MKDHPTATREEELYHESAVELAHMVVELEDKLGRASEKPWHQAAVNAWYSWDRFSRASTPIEQADAIADLANSMSDLATWLPGYDDRTGRIVEADEVV